MLMGVFSWQSACSTLVAGLLAVTAAGATDDGITLETIALTGTAAPGGDPTQMFSQLTEGYINASGQVVFQARLDGPGIDNTNDDGVWTTADGTLREVAREGGSATGFGPNTIYSSVSMIGLNQAGQVAFSAGLAGPGLVGVTRSSLWVDSAAGPALVLQGNEQVDGAIPGTLYGRFFGGAKWLNGQGAIAADVVLTGPDVTQDNDRAVVVATSANVFLAAREGDQLPRGTIGGRNPPRIWSLGSRDITLNGFNNAGEGVFTGSVIGGAPDLSSDDIVGVINDGGLVSVVARAGQLAAGTTATTRFRDFAISGSDLAINESGHVVFSALLTGPGVDSFNEKGIWLNRVDGSDPQLVARSGQPVPSDALGQELELRGFGDIRLNDQGRVAFLASAAPSGSFDGRSGVWTAKDGLQQLIALEDEPAPGTEADTQFSFFPSFSLRLNDAGLVIFPAGFKGPSVDASNDRGLFVSDRGAAPRLILREGDVIDLDESSNGLGLRTITAIHTFSQPSNLDGSSTFNNAGQLPVTLSFDDGSQGIFVLAVPEPGCVCLLLAGLLISTRSDGRHPDHTKEQ